MKINPIKNSNLNETYFYKKKKKKYTNLIEKKNIYSNKDFSMKGAHRRS